MSNIKHTRYQIAKFIEYDDAERFCKMFQHGLYIVCATVEL